MATKPWLPARILKVIDTPAGMVDRWVRSDNLEKAMFEGWEPARSINKGKEDAPFVTLQDGTKIDGIIRRRNLILCRMSIELKEARTKHFQSLTDGLLESSVREFETAVGKKETYGKVEVGKG